MTTDKFDLILDKINDLKDSHNNRLDAIDNNLDIHMKRCDELERNNELIKKNIDLKIAQNRNKIEDLEKPKEAFQLLWKLFLGAGAGAAVILGILKLVAFFGV